MGRLQARDGQRRNLGDRIGCPKTFKRQGGDSALRQYLRARPSGAQTRSQNNQQ